MSIFIPLNQSYFEKIYNLGVTVIPTHRPIKRNDFNDVIYKSMQAKYKAVIKEVSEYYSKGQPVLIGTVSVEVSELLSKMLKQKGIPVIELTLVFKKPSISGDLERIQFKVL